MRFSLCRNVVQIWFLIEMMYRRSQGTFFESAIGKETGRGKIVEREHFKFPSHMTNSNIHQYVYAKMN